MVRSRGDRNARPSNCRPHQIIADLIDACSAAVLSFGVRLDPSHAEAQNAEKRGPAIERSGGNTPDGQLRAPPAMEHGADWGNQ
jgi:hypothetical protein